jgi:hypothetical protein
MDRLEVVLAPDKAFYPNGGVSLPGFYVGHIFYLVVAMFSAN